jgi:hypothetical protein
MPNKPIVIAALRVKNEAKWIAEVLSTLGFCERIYVFDDHSEDETARIAMNAGAEIILSPFKGLDEARDKEYLTKTICADFGPRAWVLMIDGDELMEPGSHQKILDSICSQSRPGFSLRILYLWDDRNQIRIDGVYGSFSRPSLFTLNQPLGFKVTHIAGNMHCSSVPAAAIGKTGICSAAILHLGYMEREDRIRKWKYYNSIDPSNRAEGWNPARPEMGSYPHIVQGDLPQIPAYMRLMHAGPLKLVSLGDRQCRP